MKTKKLLLLLCSIIFVFGCGNERQAPTVVDVVEPVVEQPQVILPIDTVYPEFPGGEEALCKYLKKHHNIVAKNKCASLVFEVDSNGVAHYVSRCYGHGIPTRESLYKAIIDSMPAWTPGKVGGKAIRFCYMFDNVYNSKPAGDIDVINIGYETDKHKLIGEWYLLNRFGEAVKMFPTFDEGDYTAFSINLNYQLLVQSGDKEPIQPDFQLLPNNEYILDSIRGRYAVNESADVLTMSYTDINNKEQQLMFTRAQPKHISISPPLPKAIQITEILKIVEDDAEYDKKEIIPSDKPAVLNESSTEEEIFNIVEKQPEFPGGMQALMKYLQDNIKYPKESREKGLQARSYVNFLVNEDGAISDAKIMKSSGDPYLDEEAIRVVESMPNWIPGRQGGKAVHVRFTLPIMFRLK
ncbi:MAG: energy transducer TonB [Bacteroidaceae bacterium]|nr:energy transducer TonB [Bacteroidaceae bacterium]